jgi:hypothetical protein
MRRSVRSGDNQNDAVLSRRSVWIVVARIGSYALADGGGSSNSS